MKTPFWILVIAVLLFAGCASRPDQPSREQRRAAAVGAENLQRNAEPAETPGPAVSASVREAQPESAGGIGAAGVEGSEAGTQGAGEGGGHGILFWFYVVLGLLFLAWLVLLIWHKVSHHGSRRGERA